MTSPPISARPWSAPRSRARSSTSTATRRAPRSIPVRRRPELCPTTTFDGEPLYREPAMEPGATGDRRRRVTLLRSLSCARCGRDRHGCAPRHRQIVLYDCHSIRSVDPAPVRGHACRTSTSAPTAARAARRADRRASWRLRNAAGFSHVVNGRFQGRLDHPPPRHARRPASTPSRWSSHAAATCDEPAGSVARSLAGALRPRRARAHARRARATPASLPRLCRRPA